MKANSNETQQISTSQEKPQAAKAESAGQSKEEQKSFAERMATMERPKVDDRVKTEDVTNTQGLTFRDFNLADSVQFVRLPTSFPIYLSDSLFFHVF